MLACAECHKIAVFCEDCDMRQRYCSDECAKLARQRLQRLSGARYQKTFEGAQKHAARQASYRIRQREKVTHQYFSSSDSSEIVEQAEQETAESTVLQPETTPAPLCCKSCGRRCDFVVRSWPWPRLRLPASRIQGETDDGLKRYRSGYRSLVPC
jgi:hypothetical protein